MSYGGGKVNGDGHQGNGAGTGLIGGNGYGVGDGDGGYGAGTGNSYSDGNGRGNGYSAGDSYRNGDGSGFSDGKLLDVYCWCGGRLSGALECSVCDTQLTPRQIALLAKKTPAAQAALRLGVR